jgi:hypothetical protein
MVLVLIRRQAAGYHFRLDSEVYSRSDAGEWFREYAPGTWEPLHDAPAGALETLFREWQAANP